MSEERCGLRHFTWFGADIDADVKIHVVYKEIFKDESPSVANKNEVLLRKRKYIQNKKNPRKSQHVVTVAATTTPTASTDARPPDGGANKPPAQQPVDQESDTAKEGGLKNGSHTKSGFINYNEDGTVWKKKFQVN